MINKIKIFFLRLAYYMVMIEFITDDNRKVVIQLEKTIIEAYKRVLENEMLNEC